MLRTPIALLFLLTPLVGCGEESDPARDEANAESRAAEWSPTTPFRDDICLPEASQARPWQPPAEGPVPVVEILRDGSWILDGEPVEGEGQSLQDALAKRLRAITKRMPREPMVPGDDSGPSLPSNPALLRVDRDAPWRSLRDALLACHSGAAEIIRVELQIDGEGAPEVWCLPIPMGRDVGILCGLLAMVQHVRLVLEPNGTLASVGTEEMASPARISFEVCLDVEGDPEKPTEERFSSADALLARLRELEVSDLHLRAPPDTPVRVVVAALDLGTQIHPDTWDFTDP